MTEVWALAAFWLGLALIAGVLAMRYRISSAMAEVVMGTVAQLILSITIGSGFLGSEESWVKFLSGVGVMLLTFLAGAELEPEVLKLKWREAASLGSVSFLAPFFLCGRSLIICLDGASCRVGSRAWRWEGLRSRSSTPR